MDNKGEVKGKEGMSIDMDPNIETQLELTFGVTKAKESILSKI